MDVIDAIHQRRSVREFTRELVARAVLLRLIDSALWAPSAVNEQPCRFTVVQDQEMLDSISKQAKAHQLAETSAATPGHLREMLGDPEFHIFYHAPALIVISAASAGPWVVEDCALAAQNLMLAARAEGLGTCWIGFAQGWLKTAEGKMVLGLPATHHPVAPIIVGHPTAWPAPVARKPAQVSWIG